MSMMKCLNCGTSIPSNNETCPGCGVLLKTLLHNTLPSGTVLGGRYTVDHVIGKGGFGITYLATHNILDEKVAIKEFFPDEFVFRHSEKSVKPRSGDEDVFGRNRQRFLREGKILYQLRNQKGIIGCLDLLEENGTVYLVMEYLHGRTLKDEMQSVPSKLSEERVMAICEQVLDALELLHQRDIYHLDIKPDNLWVKENGEIVLLDFGASRKGMNRASTQAFTLEYAPPELLADNQPTGPFSDLFSLGMLCYELLAGQKAPRCTERIFNDALEVSGLPEGWQAVLKGALVINPSERLKNVKAWQDLFKPESQTRNYATIAGQAKQPLPKLTNHLGMEFVLIQPGTFKMGSPDGEAKRYNNEILHQVTLTKAYYLQSTPVTQEQWTAVMGSNPSRFIGQELPVEQVSWADCEEFIEKLNRQGEGRYALPTEAQWEYACRAGSDTPFSIGNGFDFDSSQANFNGNFPYGDGKKGVKRKATTPVKTFVPNAWGLYDMHGNVWEWVADWYGKYPTGSVIDPTGPETGTSRLTRGGSWSDFAMYCRSAFRDSCRSPDRRYTFFGFRLLRYP